MEEEKQVWSDYGICRGFGGYSASTVHVIYQAGIKRFKAHKTCPYFLCYISLQEAYYAFENTFNHFFSIPNVDLKNITPVSYKDIFPIARASLATTNIWIFITLMYIFNDKFWDKKNIKKMTMATNIFHVLVTPPLIITCIGAFGYPLVERLPYAYLTTIKQISLFNTLERLEPYIISLWVASDFIIILLFSYMALHMLKSLFNLTEVKQMINIYLLFIYFFSLYIVRAKFELDNFTEIIEIPLKCCFAL